MKASRGGTWAAVLVVACLFAPRPSHAQRHPLWQRPFDGDRSLSNGFDLDRQAGTEADWRGWSAGDADGLHAPHPLDDHAGCDFPMPNATPVRAVEDGVVSAVSDGVPWDDAAGANWVELRHPDGRSSVYWHLGPGLRASVSPGVSVQAGAMLGPSDNTGDSTGPHLHLGDFEEGVAGDPFRRVRFLDPSLAGRVRCVVSSTEPAPLRRAPQLDSEVVGSLPPGQCVFVTEERSGVARVHVPRGEVVVGARGPDGCEVVSFSKDGPWAPTAVQWSGTQPYAAGSWFSEVDGTPLVAAVDLLTSSPFSVEVAVAFSGPANARVRWSLTTHEGAAEGTFDAVGRPPGTPRWPIDVPAPSFTDVSTTRGGPRVHSRSSCTNAPPLDGPERWYRIKLATPTRIDARLSTASANTGLFLLAAADGNRCLSASRGRLVSSPLAVGTYWLVVEVSDPLQPALGLDYTLQVDGAGIARGTDYTSDRWLSLGTHRLSTNPRLTLQWDGSPVVEGRPYRAAIEAVRIRPVERFTSAFAELSALGEVVDRPDVVVLSRRDATPLHYGPSQASPVVAFAPLGSHLVAGARNAGFVSVQVPGVVEPLHAQAGDVTVFDGRDFAVPRTCPANVEDPQANTFDRDGDGVLDAIDHCPDVADPAQPDGDSDQVGDACDACPADPLDDRDGDGRCDGVDACPVVPDDGVDDDQDGLPDACDPCPADPTNDADEDDVCGPPIPPVATPCGCQGAGPMGVVLLSALAMRRRKTSEIRVLSGLRG